MRRALPTLFAVFAAVVGSANVAATSGEPLLLRTPTVSATSVVFAYADDLWIVMPMRHAAVADVVPATEETALPQAACGGFWGRTEAPDLASRR